MALVSLIGARLGALAITSPIALVPAVGLLLIATWLACLGPARRAGRLAPHEALHD
jgi:ABC-type lipoprotein release transport system permease subunit